MMISQVDRCTNHGSYNLARITVCFELLDRVVLIERSSGPILSLNSERNPVEIGFDSICFTSHIVLRVGPVQ